MWKAPAFSEDPLEKTLSPIDINAKEGSIIAKLLGCKENRRYEWVSKKSLSEVKTEEKDFFRHPSSINDFPATSRCFAIIIYLISPTNCELMAIYQAEQSGPDQMLLPTLM